MTGIKPEFVDRKVEVTLTYKKLALIEQAVHNAAELYRRLVGHEIPTLNEFKNPFDEIEDELSEYFEGVYSD